MVCMTIDNDRAQKKTKFSALSQCSCRISSDKRSTALRGVSTTGRDKNVNVININKSENIIRVLFGSIMVKIRLTVSNLTLPFTPTSAKVAINACPATTMKLFPRACTTKRAEGSSVSVAYTPSCHPIMRCILLSLHWQRSHLHTTLRCVYRIH